MPWNNAILHPEEMLVYSTFPTLVLGDFNLHTPLADPLHFYSHAEIHVSEPFMDLALDLGYHLLNSPGIYTHFPYYTHHKPLTIDLTFAHQPLATFRISWDNSTLSTDSNHTSSRTKIYLTFTISPYTTTDLHNIDWNTTSQDLKDLEIQDFSLYNNLDSWFDHAYSLITNTMSSNTMSRCPLIWSKRWWTPNLTEKRCIFHHLLHTSKRTHNPSDYEDMKTARKTFFKAIQTAKRNS
jgi:hypothetical protein